MSRTDRFKKSRDERLAQFDEQMTAMADTLLYWLDQNNAYSALSIYFLAGVLKALMDESWPDNKTRPEIYSKLMTAIDNLGAELGPVVHELEIQGLPAYVRSERKTKSVVN